MSKTNETESYIKVGRYTIKVSHLDRIIFPKAKITKGDLIDYYERIAPIMLPYLKDRLLTMKRYPTGIQGEGFFHKDAPDYFPSFIKRKAITRSDGQIVNFVVCNNEATLVYIANHGCITPHIGLSKIDKLNYPDKMIFDLDPSIKKFEQVQEGAFYLKAVLDELELPNFVMTTGSRGLHIVVPIKRLRTFDWVRKFAGSIGGLLVQQHPKLFTMQIRKNKRGRKIFIDVLRNASRQTAVAPYAVRPRPGAPIATPITWQEAARKTLTPTQYTIKNIFKRIDKVGDIWSDMSSHAVSLTRAAKTISTLLS